MIKEENYITKNITIKYKSLSILYNNICAIKNKTDIILCNIDKLSPDIICIVETRYKNLLDVHSFDDYVGFHNLQIGKKTGGISIWAKTYIKPTKLDIDGYADELSTMYSWILCQNNGPTAICTIYFKNQSDEDAAKLNVDICQRLLNHINWCNDNNYEVILVGDFNGHIGNDEYGIPGNHTKINSNGNIVRDFIRLCDLNLGNNDKITEGKWTWGAGRNNCQPQILDLVFHSPSSIINKMVIDEKNWELGTGNKDHCFIYLEFRIFQLNQNGNTNLPILKNKWNITTDVDWTEYRQKLKDITDKQDTDDINEKTIIDIMIKAGEETIGYRKKKKHKPKISNRAKKLKQKITNIRKKLRHGDGDTQENLNQLFTYIQEQRELRMKTEMARIEKAHNKWLADPKRKFHQLYDTMKTMKRGLQEPVTLLDNDKKPIIEEIKIKSYLKDFWNDIFTLGIWPDANDTMNRVGLDNIIKGTDRLEQEKDITYKELDDAIKRLKNGTSSGTTNIPPEFIKNWPEEMKHMALTLFNRWYETGFFPDIGKTQDVTLLHKKGSKSDIKNYRTLCLGCNLCKIYLTILTKRLEKTTEEKNILGYIQHGFRANKRIEDCILVIQHVVNKAKKNSILALLDICKAYDRVWRKGLWKKLRDYGFSEKLIRAIESSYHNPGAFISFQDYISERLPMPVGLRQGCVMSPILWALFIADLGSEIERSNLGITIGNRENKENISGIFFADDMLLFASSEYNMTKLLDIVGKYANKWKIEFSGPKSLIIPIKRDIDPDNKWKLGKMYISESEERTIYINEEKEAKYLGITLNQSKNDILAKHKENLYNVTKRETGRCYRPAVTTARPITYGAQIWTVYVAPKVLHGIAAIPFKAYNFTKPETQQREYIRLISKLPRHTHRAVLYGETKIMPLMYEAEKRTINYLLHLMKLDNKNIVKLVLLEQLEIYNDNPSKQTWLQHAIKCCQKYGITYTDKITSYIVKDIVRKKWIIEYNEMMEDSPTLKYYKTKEIPYINKKLNLIAGGEYWIKAKSGCLLINNRKHTTCTRCTTSEIETLEHMLWLCPTNYIDNMLKKGLYELWGMLPPKLDIYSKTNIIPTISNEYIILSVQWILDDSTSGSIINVAGNIIKKIFKSRPETQEYNLYIRNSRSNNTNDNNDSGDNVNRNGNDGRNGDDGRNTGDDNITLNNRQNQTIPDNREGIT